MPSRRAFLAGSAAALSLPATAGAQSAEAAPSLAWARRYDTDGRAAIRAIVALPHGYALLGSVGADAATRGWLARTDHDGRARDSLAVGETGTRFRDGVPAGAGVLAAGRTNAASSSADPFAARATGGDETSVDWASTYSPDAPGGGVTATARLTEGSVLAGAVRSDGGPRPWAVGVDGAGTVRWTWRGDAAGAVTDAIAVPDGVVLVGSTRNPERAWAVGLDSAGERRWRWTAERDERSRLTAVAPAAEAGVVAVGRRGFDPGRGVGRLLAFSPDGQRRWARTYTRDAWNWHDDVARVGDGYVLAGSIGDVNAGERSAWLLRVGPDGGERWERRAAAGTRAFTTRAVADGGLLVGGADRAGDTERAWLARFGGADGGGSGFRLPSLPDAPSWAAPLGVGAVAGAAGSALARRLGDD